jgi:iron(III) transport system ATP-binding protein
MLVLLGESGSGKTTLLRCIAGLEKPDAGDINLAGKVVFSSKTGKNEPTRARQLGMIFQSYALWPHMTVAANVGYPLTVRGVAPKERSARVANYLALAGCSHLGQRYPHELSGGQQQRIALARTLVYEPKIVLFDEPLSNLDAGLRDDLRLHIREVKRRLGLTGIYVTHDQAEAFFLADKVAIMANGRLLQIGLPREVYSHPGSLEVAQFLGCTNILEGMYTQVDGKWSIVAAERDPVEISSAVRLGVFNNASGTICARPDATLIGLSEGSPLPGRLSGEIRDVVDLGGQLEYVIRLKDGRLWRSRAVSSPEGLDPGKIVEVTVKDGHLFAFGSNVGGSLPNEVSTPMTRPASTADARESLLR